MNPREIEVHIEELVLHGFAPGTRKSVAAALERELSTLLAARGVPAVWHASPERIDAGTVRTNPWMKPAMAGEQIGRAVYGDDMR